MRAAAARALAPLIRAQDVRARWRRRSATPPLSATTGRLRFRRLRDVASLLARSASPARVQRRARRLLCAAELLGLRARRRRARRRTRWRRWRRRRRDCLCVHTWRTPGVAGGRRRRRMGSLRARDAAVGASDTYQAGTRTSKHRKNTGKNNSISEEMSEMSFFSASRRLTRLARAACDVPATARGFVAASGGALRGARLAPASPSRPGTSSGSSEPRVFAASRRWTRRASKAGSARTERPRSVFGGGEEEKEIRSVDETRLRTSAKFSGAHDETYDAGSDDDGSIMTKGRRRDDAFRAFVTTLHPSVPYESRASALRALRDAGASRVLHSLGPKRFVALRRFVAETLLPSEKRHACARRALEIIEQWTGFLFLSGKFRESQSLDLSPELWRVVEKRASADANERVRCAATRALGKLAGARGAAYGKTVWLGDMEKRRRRERRGADARAALHSSRSSRRGAR